MAIINWDGNQAVLPVVGSSADFYGLWSSASAAVAVGSGGVLARQSGASWTATTLAAASGLTLRGVFGVAPSNLWIVGDSGLILRWNGTTATAVPSGVTDTLHAISGSAANNLWAVGDRGRVLHSDGNTWTVDAAGSGLTTEALYAVTVTSAGVVYAVGNNGTLLRYSGQKWRALDSGTIAPLRAVWQSGGGDILIAGQGGSILRLRAS